MAIKGEVHVKSMIWAPKISLNDGRYVIRPFECKIIGQAEGLARVKASIHTLFTTFDDEEWRITLFVNHLDSQLKYTDLFAASCGSLGEFTDIKQSEEGYAMTLFFFFLRLPIGQYGPVSQLSRSEESCTGPFNWGEAHCAGEKVKRKIGPFLRKSLKNQTRKEHNKRGAARHGNQEPPGQAPRCTGQRGNKHNKQETSPTNLSTP